MADVELPEMTEDGLLPVGIHDCDLDAVEERFGGVQHSDWRPKLFQKLKDYVDEVQKAGWAVSIIVNGSFVMSSVDEPSDIDLIIVLPEDWDMAAPVKPFEYNLLSRKRVRRLYGFDVFAVRDGSVAYTEWTEFFMTVSTRWCSQLGLPAGIQKGIVRVVP